MKEQVNVDVKSCNYHTQTIGRIRHCLSFEAATNLIHAFATSRYDYGNSLLSGLPDNERKKLQRVQNIATHILSKTKKYDHIYVQY